MASERSPFHGQLERIEQLYGFAFPSDLVEVWEVASRCSPEAPLEAFQESLGIELVGPFDVLAGLFDGAMPRYSILLHRRYSADPPEFFTVMMSVDASLHWGYWLDAPGEDAGVVAGYSTKDPAMKLSMMGVDLWMALRCQLEWLDEEAEQALLTRGQAMAATERELWESKRTMLAALREIILPYAPGEPVGSGYIHSLSEVENPRGQLAPVLPTSDGMGIACPEDSYRAFDVDEEGANPFTWDNIPRLAEEAIAMLEEGLPGAALWLGRELWRLEGVEERRDDLLQRAYDALGRPVLSQIVATLAASPYLLDTNMLSYASGDFHDLDEALAHPQEVRKLELGGKMLRELPDAIGALTGMTYLDAWGNELRTLPDAMRGCAALETAMLHINQFEELPAVLCGLPNLQELVIARCRLKRIGAAIGRCGALRRLDLHQNRLTEAPDSLSPELFSLATLEVLSLGENRLTTLPDGFSRLRLKKLDLRENRLTEVPAALLSMESLEQLDLRKNQIEALPDDLSSWHHLTSLRLEGNPLSPTELTRLYTALPDVDITT